MRFTNIRILFSSQCPGYRESLEVAIRAADILEVDAAIEQIDVKTKEDAVKLRYLGSPTVQVEGEDVELAARVRTDYGIGVRYYEGGVSHPSLDMLLRALATIDGSQADLVAERREAIVEVLIAD